MRGFKPFIALSAALLALPASAQPASQTADHQTFSTHLLEAQSRNHLLGEYATGSEDNVDLSQLRLAASLDVGQLTAARTPVQVALIGQYAATEIEFDAPPPFADRDFEIDTVDIGAKGTWTVPAEPALNLSTGAYLSFADFEAPNGAEDDESGVVFFGSARYAVSPRFDTYGTLLISTEDRLQDSGIVAGLLYDLGTPDDTTITPYLSWAAGPTIRLNAGIQTGADVDPVFRGQLAWLLGG